MLDRRPKRILIIFASTSGSTRIVVQSMEGALLGHQVEILDLANASTVQSDAAIDLLVLGTPSYGRGDCHYKWHEKGSLVLSGYSRTRTALFCLGDSRSHAKTFGGGLTLLAGIARAADLDIVDPTGFGKNYQTAAQFTSEGMILDFKRYRQIAKAAGEEWIRMCVLGGSNMVAVV